MCITYNINFIKGSKLLYFCLDCSIGLDVLCFYFEIRYLFMSAYSHRDQLPRSGIEVDLDYWVKDLYQ